MLSALSRTASRSIRNGGGAALSRAFSVEASFDLSGSFLVRHGHGCPREECVRQLLECLVEISRHCEFTVKLVSQTVMSL